MGNVGSEKYNEENIKKVNKKWGMKQKHKNEQKIIRIVNALAYIVMILVNYFAATGKINNTTTTLVSYKYKTPLTPIDLTFSIWGVIYTLLLGFTIYQLLPSQKYNKYIKNMDVFFIITCLANCLWLFTWQYEKLILSVVMMIILFISLVAIYRRLDIGSCRISFLNKLFINIPFSIYTAWISIALVLNIGSAIQSINGMQEIFDSSIIVVIVLIILAIGGLYVSIKNNDLFFLLTYMWAFLGILARYWNRDTLITLVCLSVLLIMAIQMISRFKRFLCA